MQGPGDRVWAARLLFRYELLTNSAWTPGIAVCLILTSYIAGYTLTPQYPAGLPSQPAVVPLTGGSPVAFLPWRGGEGAHDTARPAGLGRVGAGGLGLGRVAREDVLNSTGDALVPPFPPRREELRVAVCLVGGARDSDLTLPSILERLLPAYPNPHLFVHVPLDENSFKLRAFAWAAPNVTVAAVRLYSNWWVDLRRYPRQLVQDPTSPQGTQGMYQYFRLVEGCLPLIMQHEAVHGFRFNWIVRTRVDTFWRKPPEPLEGLPPEYYTIPHGTNCMGYNDRMGVGTWRTSRFALARLSLLARIEHRWPSWRNLNSEMGFKSQLLVTNTKAARASFWFCVVSRRTYVDNMMPVASIASAAALNGAKCRPCTPLYTGKQADAKLAGYSVNAQLGPIKTGVDLCAAEKGWEEGWEAIFDRDAGPHLAQQRQRIMGPGLEECVADFEALKGRAEAWDAAPPRVLCVRRELGPTVPLGGHGTSFHVLLPWLKRKAGPGGTVSALVGWDGEGAQSAGRSDLWASQVLGNWTHHMGQVLGKEGMKLQAASLGPGLPLPAEPATPEPGLEALVLVLAVQQAEISRTLKAWTEAKSMPTVCQLLVAYRADQGPRDNPSGREEFTWFLLDLGFWLDSCIMEKDSDAERCTYFSLVHCQG